MDSGEEVDSYFDPESGAKDWNPTGGGHSFSFNREMFESLTSLFFHRRPLPNLYSRCMLVGKDTLSP